MEDGGGGAGAELGCPIPGRIAFSEAPGALELLLTTSGAGAAAIEELPPRVTGATIFSDGSTVGRCEFTGAVFFSVFATNELPAAPVPPGTGLDF